jgi:hypothetical protein
MQSCGQLTPVAAGEVPGLLSVPVGLPDPRDRRGVRHRLIAILAVAVMSVLCGATNYRELEEDLARTLEHEKPHHDDLASGKPFPKTREEADLWEDRAYAREDRWWDNQPVRPEG